MKFRLVVMYHYRQMAARVAERPYEANWVIVDQPRCCSDCTYVAAGFKCKVKSCLQNCPWARSAGNCFTDPRIYMLVQ